MKIVVLGSGPTQLVEGRGRNRRTNSSVYIEKAGKSFIIDVTKHFKEQVEKNGIEKIDFCLLTHAHEDCIGGLSDMDKWLSEPVNVYAPPKVLANERLQKKFKNIVFKPITPHQTNKIMGFKIIPFRVIHAEPFPTGKKFPCYGYRIDGLVYAEDMESVPAENEQYLKNADTMILDAAIYNLEEKGGEIVATGKMLRGHLNVADSLAYAQIYNPDKFVLIQAGRSYPDYYKAEKQIQRYWNQIKGKSSSEIILSYDSMVLYQDHELMQQAFGSPGGKSRVAEKLIRMMPQHKIYCEPFAGGAAVFWRKSPSEVEVLNDLDSEIAFAYRFIQNTSAEEAQKLKQYEWKNDKPTFFKIKELKPKNDIERFAKFLYLTRYSYGIDRETYGWFNKKKLLGILSRWDALRERLKNVKIYNRDYKPIIKEFDSPQTFFFVDPPYPDEWEFESDGLKFTKENLEELRDVLKSIKGKFLLTLNNADWIRDLFKDFRMKKMLHKRTFAKDDKPEYELVFSNYDPDSIDLSQSRVELQLFEQREGIYLPSPHAKWLWGGKKSLIIKTRPYPEMVDKALYVVDKEFVYGVIRLHAPNRITKKQFDERANLHLISDNDIEKWGWKDKKYFYEFSFEWITKFATPRRWKFKKGTQTFVKDIEFLNSDYAPKMNSPTFAYYAVYNKMPPGGWLSGRTNGPKKSWNGFNDIDIHIKDEWLERLNGIKEIEIRASDEGKSPERVAFIVFRMANPADDDKAEDISKELDKQDGLYSKCDIGAENRPRVVVAGKVWYGEKGWESWWDSLAEKIESVLEKFEFQNIEANLIQNPETYDPQKLDTDVLKDDYRIVCAHYSKLKRGEKTPYSEETLVNLAKMIYEELKKRGIEFHPETYKKWSLDLYKRITGKKEMIHKKVDLTNLDFLDAFKDFKIVKDCISLVGSTVKRPKGHIPNDVDLQIRLRAEKNSYIRRAIEVRLLKMLEENGYVELIPKIHMIWGDSEGSHDSFIPLYDLKLERIKPTKIVEMNEIILGDSVRLFEPYLPQKPFGSAYYKIDDIMAKIRNDVEYSVEKKINGFHVCCHKKGSEVKIFSEQKKELTFAFPTLCDAISKMSDGNFIVDGEIVPFDDGKQLGRNALMKFIGAIESGKKVDDKNIKIVIWDIVYFDNDITNLSLRERIKYLNKLNFGPRTLLIQRKFAKGVDEVEKAIKWAKDLPYSEGAVIKDLSAKYHFGEHRSWLKYRNLVDIDAVILERIPKEKNLYNYLVGVYLREKDSGINPDKITEFKGKKVLVLGKTFNTSEKYEVGDILSILVEEVWRHESDKGRWYSIHKPRVNHITEKKETSTIDELEDIVTSIGVAVKHEELKKEPEEAKEVKIIRDFPKRMQRNFKKIMNNKLWMPYVIHLHSIGRKTHRDVRLFVPDKITHKVLTYDDALALFKKGDLKGCLEGITLFTPATIEESNYADSSHVRGTIKLTEPVDWLFFDGVTHRIGTAKTHYPGVFIIISRGVYTIHEVTDHKIRIEFRSDKGDVNLKPLQMAKKEGAPTLIKPPKKLIDMTGEYSFHIAHIGPQTWIMLFDKIKKAGQPVKVTGKILKQIIELTAKNESRRSISLATGLSKNTVYRYQKVLKLI